MMVWICGGRGEEGRGGHNHILSYQVKVKILVKFKNKNLTKLKMKKILLYFKSNLIYCGFQVLREMSVAMLA